MYLNVVTGFNVGTICKPQLSEDMKSAMNAFHRELDLSSKYWEDPERAIALAKKYIELTPDLEFINGWGTPVGVIAELSSAVNKVKEKGTRGGKRKGAGRKKKEPTIVMRVPESLVEQVNKMIEEHKKQHGEK